ncbi:hypothetical protein LJB71_15080 [Thermomonas sp. S9]|uniref:hypothetical protein n=1 Tax=Thermomonas sp. S9 TaxID=2885203 RepID=UPI00216B4CD4|nr:hypothetical protein [Thermomonas sp. S9]MCR6497401.1 hypothetical protein [Thermomonas sp. S9]
MPAARPRMHVTPSESVHALLRELSQLTGKPPATIVREMLDEAAPALEMAVQAFRALHRRPQEAQAAIARMAAKAHQTIAQATLDLDKASEGKRGRKPRGEAAKTG